MSSAFGVCTSEVQGVTGIEGKGATLKEHQLLFGVILGVLLLGRSRTSSFRWRSFAFPSWQWVRLESPHVQWRACPEVWGLQTTRKYSPDLDPLSSRRISAHLDSQTEGHVLKKPRQWCELPCLVSRHQHAQQLSSFQRVNLPLLWCWGLVCPPQTCLADSSGFWGDLKCS